MAVVRVTARDAGNHTATQDVTINVQTGPQQLWPGHQPDETYVGMTFGSFYAGNHGCRRFYYNSWSGGDNSQDNARILEDHAANRIPWTSNKPLNTWAAVANGSQDPTYVPWINRYKAYAKPVLFTFSHEPFDDTSSRGTAAQFVAAFEHMMDLAAAGSGPGNLVLCPILHGHNLLDVGDEWLSDRMVNECGLIGVDTYRKAPDVVDIFDYLEGRGVRSVGIGETGRGPAGTGSGLTPNTLAEFDAKLDLFEQRSDLLSVCCYFNTNNHNFQTGWPNGSQFQARWDQYAATGVRLT